ncbi:MAG TPA: carboxymuconolactone decarboxylase family protein [Clostridia bacterium]|nr:carboxymuconolactone decarboxylase family protein [Clostridia bacterium]
MIQLALVRFPCILSEVVYMARISFSTVEESAFGQLLGHNPEILKAWRELERTVYSAGSLGPELKEQVRSALAFGNGCVYCQAFGTRPTGVYPDPKISLAVAFADLFIRDHLAMDDSTFAVLKEEFTDAQISELVAFVCFVSAGQRLGATLKLEAELARV